MEKNVDEDIYVANRSNWKQSLWLSGICSTSRQKQGTAAGSGIRCHHRTRRRCHRRAVSGATITVKSLETRERLG